MSAGKAQGWEHANAWITYEADMNRILDPATDLLMDRAGDVRGKHVLDIGCGTGAVTARFADAGALVTASDVSEDFLSYVSDNAGPRVETHHADAQTATWPRLFDLAVSRFGVMFFADPKAAFRNIAQALKPGGRLVFVAWAAYDDNPWFHVPDAAACRLFCTSLSSPDPHATGPFGLSDREWALRQMANDELMDLQCDTVEVHLSHPEGVQTAAALLTRIGFVARQLRERSADEETRLEAVNAVAEALSVFDLNGLMQVPAALHVYSARRV